MKERIPINISREKGLKKYVMGNLKIVFMWSMRCKPTLLSIQWNNQKNLQWSKGFAVREFLGETQRDVKIFRFRW